MGSAAKMSLAAQTASPDGAQTALPAREPRTRALLIASVSSLDNALSTPCVVNNLSGSGARMTISASIPLGAEFRVSIPQRNLSRLARQVWRKGDQLGIVFQPDADATSSPDDDDKEKKIRTLEAENTSLKAEIGVLKYYIYRREET